MKQTLGITVTLLVACFLVLFVDYALTLQEEAEKPKRTRHEWVIENADDVFVSADSVRFLGQTPFQAMRETYLGRDDGMIRGVRTALQMDELRGRWTVMIITNYGGIIERNNVKRNGRWTRPGAPPSYAQLDDKGRMCEYMRKLREEIAETNANVILLQVNEHNPGPQNCRPQRRYTPDSPNPDCPDCESTPTWYASPSANGQVNGIIRAHAWVDAVILNAEHSGKAGESLAPNARGILPVVALIDPSGMLSAYATRLPGVSTTSDAIRSHITGAPMRTRPPKVDDDQELEQGFLAHAGRRIKSFSPPQHAQPPAVAETGREHDYMLIPARRLSDIYRLPYAHPVSFFQIRQLHRLVLKPQHIQTSAPA